MVRGRGHRRFWGLGGMGPPTTGVRAVQRGNSLEPSLPVHRQTHTHRHTCTWTDVHTHVHMHRRHTDTLTQYNMHTNIHTLRHTYHTDVHAVHTYIHTWADKTPSTHMYIHTHRKAHMHRHMCAQANPDAHMSLTHTRTHTYAQTPAQGMMMPFALGWKVLGAERQRNGGWGSETSVFLSVESPQHLGAGTREEQ